MYRIIYILLAAALACGVPGLAFSQTGGDSLPQRKKVAVVLSGGGAKGVAHIGALRVIEEAGIPIDIIVGTSMGSIIGGLYSIGYTPDQLEQMVMSQDWRLLLSDRIIRTQQAFAQKEYDEKYLVSFPFGRKMEAAFSGGLIRGVNLEMLFNDLTVGYHEHRNFDELPIPFACVAANVVDGGTVVFREGVLPVAMRASMAIPGVFAPVYLDDMVLVDGGMVNNFPTDVAMEMGADIVIGVDVPAEKKTRDELNNAPAILKQLMDLMLHQRLYQRNVELSDVYIKVDVAGYSSASFNLPALDSLIQRGERAARDHSDELADLPARIGIDGSHTLPQRTAYTRLGEMDKFRVYNITFPGLMESQMMWVMRKCKMKPGAEMDIRSLDRCMSVLNATKSYTNIYYSLTDTLDGFNLRFEMEQMRGHSLNLGVNFDSEEIASVLVNGTFRFGQKVGSQVSVTGRFGKRIMGDVNYALFVSPLTNFNFGYTFTHNDIMISSGGRKSFNPTYNHHKVTLGFADMNFMRQNLKMGVGVRAEYFYFRSWLRDVSFSHEGEAIELESERFLSYYGRLDFETFDKKYFASRGTSALVSYELYTDNFVMYKEHAPFSAIMFSWATAIPLGKRFSLMPSIYGRILSGADIPFPFLNMVGGLFAHRYVPQQLAFDGIRFMEAAPHTFMATRLLGQQHIGRNHYVSGSFNFGLGDNSFFNILKGDTYYGASLAYGYDSRFGPLIASFGWSNITRGLTMFIQLGFVF